MPSSVCQYCNAIFYELNSFKYHVKGKICVRLKELKSSLFKCLYCQNSFITVDSYVTHVDKFCTCFFKKNTNRDNIIQLMECDKCLIKCQLKSTILYHKTFNCKFTEKIYQQKEFLDIIPFGTVTNLSDYSALFPGIEDIIHCAIFDREGETLQYLINCINCSINQPKFHNIYIDDISDKKMPMCKVFNGDRFIYMRRQKVFEIHIENLLNLVNDYIEVHHNKFISSAGKEKIKIYNAYVENIVFAKHIPSRDRLIDIDMTATLHNAMHLHDKNNYYDHIENLENLEQKTRISFTWDEIATIFLSNVSFFAGLLRTIDEHNRKSDKDAIDFMLTQLHDEYIQNSKFMPIYLPMLRIEHKLDPCWEDELIYNYFENKCKQRINIFI